MPCSHCKLSGHNIRTCRLLEIRRSMASRTISRFWMYWNWPNSPATCCLSLNSDIELPPAQSEDQVSSPQESESSSLCCPICYDDIGSNSAQTQCGHVFHTECLLRSSQENVNCPMCRTEIVKPSDKNFTQSDLLNAESNGRRQGFFDSEEVYAQQAFDYRNTIDVQGTTINEMESEMRQLKQTIARIQNEFQEKLMTIKTKQIKFREQYDIDMKKSYDDGVREGLKLTNTNFCNRRGLNFI